MELFSVFSDLHFWDKSLRSRIDYVGESVELYKKVLNEVRSVRRQYPGCKYTVILGGDIMHKDSKSVTSGIQWYQRFSILRASCDMLILVVGNHEMTWPDNNVFWTMITDCKDPMIPAASNYAKGVLPLCNIYSTLDIDNVRLHFLHYHGSVSNLGSGKNICFVHDDYFCEDLIPIIESKYELDLATQYAGFNKITDNDIMSKFDCIFYFHNHKAYGVYDVEFAEGNTCRMYHLASLGRTSKDQVVDLGVRRLCPLIKICDGDFTVENRYIDLPQAKDVLDKAKVEKADSTYARQKVRKALRLKQLDSTDPVSSILEELSAIPDAVEAFELSKSKQIPKWIRRLL